MPSRPLNIDSQKLTVTARWPMAPCECPSGLAMEREHRRLFAGCYNRVKAIMDVDSGKVLATPAIGQGVDANSFDPGTQLAVSLNDEGTPTVVHENSPDKFTLVAGASTQRRANHNSGFEDPPYLSGDGGLLPIARGHAGASSPTAADGPPYVCAPSG